MDKFFVFKITLFLEITFYFEDKSRRGSGVGECSVVGRISWQGFQVYGFLKAL